MLANDLLSRTRVLRKLKITKFFWKRWIWPLCLLISERFKLPIFLIRRKAYEDSLRAVYYMKYTNYVRRENNIYYRWRRRAVGSHTRWGDRNPNALSSYLKGEREMTAECRKNSLLPCGWTIAKSWAAL